MIVSNFTKNDKILIFFFWFWLSISMDFFPVFVVLNEWINFDWLLLFLFCLVFIIIIQILISMDFYFGNLSTKCVFGFIKINAIFSKRNHLNFWMKLLIHSEIESSTTKKEFDFSFDIRFLSNSFANISSSFFTQVLWTFFVVVVIHSFFIQEWMYYGVNDHHHFYHE